ncbi:MULTISPECIES: alpha/beta fold hydrolase [unclassified Crossiella]|uniref:alpha/beta fold hydrolase n=1 Tax=unclassified Crossiella TaxID=2620835 RepID=UPI001FFF7DB1|nr:MULTISPECIES: alpha/beta fold hydrolase [unclassified Crossiella]MCK2237034.1 alpha/beta fold hydrolase [Crossiella sp. S99.2]MCK2250702.1 alpha/beta fold hydrolase [Crossiella sp. S99.1]
MTATFVLVHGANANSFSWSAVQRELTLRGHRSLAVDLPGHGFQAGFSPAYQSPQDLDAFAAAPSTVAAATLADYVEHTVAVVRRAAEHGPVILVGHSLGGFTLGGVGNAIPDLLHRIVYIAAWCCTRPVLDYVTAPEYTEGMAMATGQALVVADPMRAGLVRMNWRTGDPARLALVHEAMFAEGTEAEFLAAINTLDPDESVHITQGDTSLDPARWGRVPRSYVRLAGDRLLPPAWQDLLIADADAANPEHPFDVHTVASSHLGFLARPAAVVDILDALAPR